jgi:membrane-associated phospholipid phosphatase
LNKSLRKRLIIGVLLLVVSAILAVFAYLTPYFPGDVGATKLIQNLSSPSLTSFMIFVSDSFTGIPAVVLAIACVVIVWWRLGRLAAIFMAIDGVLSPIANLFKYIIERPRPAATLVNILLPAVGLSFPSGHAFFAAMTLGMLVYFIIKYVSIRPLKVLLAAVLIFIILLVGFTRVYLGDHWPSDVIGSYFIAGGLLSVLTVFYEQRESSKAPGRKTPRG